MTYDRTKAVLAQVAAERDALQQKLREATAEVRQLREQTESLRRQAAAAQEAMAAREAQEQMLAEAVAERDALQQKLGEATAEVRQLREQTESLRRQAAAAQEQVASYRTQEQLIAQALLTAQRAADDLTRQAKAQAEDAIARARATSEETIQAARKSAAETLRQAQARADQAVRAVTDLATKIEAFVSGRQLLRNLAALTEGLTEALGALGRLQTGLQHEVSGLRDLARTIEDEEAGLRRPAAAPRPSAPPGALSLPPSGKQSLDGPDRQAERERVVSLGVRGEITISPVSHHYQAARMVAAISRLKGIRAARLRALTNNTACIELATEAAPLSQMDFTVIDGVPMEVVEATDTRLVLRIARPFAEAFRG